MARGPVFRQWNRRNPLLLLLLLLLRMETNITETVRLSYLSTYTAQRNSMQLYTVSQKNKTPNS